MKRIVTISCFFLFCFQLSQAELIVKIGNDTTFCPGNLDAGIELASQLLVEGGVPPCTYSWTTRIKPYEGWNAVFYANTFLNDSTLANPILKDPTIPGWSKFVLTVKDSNNTIARDSIHIRFSQFMGTVEIMPKCITLGDSILFDLSDYDTGGIHPYQSASWHPKEGLSDPNSFVTWCKPEKETYYHCIITESAGCKSTFGFSEWLIVKPKDDFIVKIGNDTTFCSENMKYGIELASRLLVEGGVPPYSYSWTARIKPYDIWDAVFYAHHFLNDTTLANPIIKDITFPGWNKFVLTVKDSNNTIAKDSINIRFSEFRTHLGEEPPICVTLGDSILFDLSNIDIGGIHPYQSASWHPQEGLSDPNSFVTWCKPEKETYYECIIIDSAGCVSGISKQVVVKPTAIDPVVEKDGIYQDGKTIYFNNQEKEQVLLSFYSLEGKLVVEAKTTSDHYEPVLLPNIYICRIQKGKESYVIKYSAL